MKKKIKVLHVSMSFEVLSAGYRLHKAILHEGGVNSYCIVKKSPLNDIHITKLSNRMLSKLKIKILLRIKKLTMNAFYRNRLNLPFSSGDISFGDIIRQINVINPDIVHFHWICGDLIKIEDIWRIKSPIVWSLHDQWGYTGGCHVVAEKTPQLSGEWLPYCDYDVDKMCNKYTESCGNCGVLRSRREKDLSFRILQRKKKAFAKVKSMTIIGVSQWMADCAKKSIVFADKKVVCLSNPIDTDIFKPLDKMQARMLWNLPNHKKLVLFGAISATSVLYKGYDLVIDALRKLATENVEFIVFGSNEPVNAPRLPYKARYLGHLTDTVSLVSLYNACDVMVHPSMREAFGLTVAESLSCGTPVVAFGHGGLLDIVDHKINGYLAQPFNTGDFAKGIDWVLNNENYDELCKNAREKVVKNFDNSVIVKKMRNLYEEVILGSSLN
ncbi:MAG: glycosyltransferase [Lentimicrobiaceae bacterium]|nr:glycosyltransferase [Lentimicrobiaceae bacterium]